MTDTRTFWKAVRPDLTTRNELKWYPNTVIRADHNLDRGSHICPKGEGDGISLAKTWAGAAQAGWSTLTCYLVEVAPDQVVAEDGDKVRVCGEITLNEPYDAQALIRAGYLIGADLTGADFTRANLTRADLTGADLTRANLTRADLTGADFTRANLTRADLTRADLTGADLTRADLTRANLTRADLTRADLTRANLTRANLTGADLTGAYLTGADPLPTMPSR